MSNRELLLIPAPRLMKIMEGSYSLRDNQLIRLEVEDPQPLLPTAQRFQRFLKDRCELNWEAHAGTSPDHLTGLSIRIASGGQIPRQGYELSIGNAGINIIGSDLAGTFYGVCTLIQIIDQCGLSLPCLQISDWPDFPVRGVMLDVSRERVPTMQTLFDFVDQLAGWKINQIQLYTEHAFAYRHHPQVWEKVSPITGQEVMELDIYCRERFIELVPNQQSFGHLAPWLNRPEYQHLAEVTDGFQTPWGYRQGSFSLSPIDPRSIEFLRGLYTELLPHFTSRMFNVGCDETWDLGQGRSKEACQRIGKERVYLDFLLQIYREVKQFGRIPQFWGDIILQHPELIPELPKDIIVLEWGYEADHPFDKNGARFAASGIPFYVCPGTSSWCSLAGRTDNAAANLLSAAENGLKHQATGYLITDWGDYGHWQPWPVSLLGLMAGAAYAWALESNRSLDILKTLSWHGFRDSSGEMGKAAYDLGNIYRLLGTEPHNSSLLFWFMQWPLEKIRSTPGLDAETFEKTMEAIDLAYAPVPGVIMDRPDHELIRDEFTLTAHFLRHACLRGLLAFETDPDKVENLKRDLDSNLSEIIRDFQKVWLLRNRKGGLSESLGRLEKLRAEYAAAEQIIGDNQ
ncbi:MAG: glycoside hydrolase [Chloroflexi bacterium]|nr:MAG: glycoside hydrolase [Chloroflexota bacterium]